MQTTPSIRKAEESDFVWISEKGAKSFSKVYKREVNKKWLELLLKKCEVYVLSDKTSFVSFVSEPEGILVNSWYGQGKGLRLWKYIEDMAKDLNKPMIGFLHKAEEKFKRFLEKRGYSISDFNQELYWVEREICHQ